jgi:hypothetical protein
MPLETKIALPMAAATAGLVFGIYQQATPSIADIRVAKPNDDHIASSERQATWTAAAAVSAISLIARDSTIFVVGGLMVIGMAWWTRHANAVNPLTGFASAAGDAQRVDLTVVPADMDAEFGDDMVAG